MNTYLDRIKSNWKSGLTVALVSIPMSVSLAVASGATPTVGIITAIWAGLMASIFGGSNYNIVGPAGALSGILAAFALTQGAASLPMLAIITGVFVLISYFLRLEKYLTYVPASTVHGFTLGVGLILAFGQLNFAFGLSNLPKHEEFIKNVLESFKNIGASDLPTFLTFAVFLALMFILLKLVKRIPPAIILTPVAIFLGYLTTIGKLPFALQTLGSKFPDIKATLVQVPVFHINTEMVIAGITVAAVAILETMLCGKVADGITGTKYNRRKEMFALSVSNLASGLAGGLPATAVLARTSLNAKSGATHKTSQGLNSIFIIIISFALLGTFKFIPLSVVAAILVFTAFRMIEQHHFIRMYRHEKRSFWIAMLVGFVTIYFDPIIGILFGTAIALLLFVEKLSKGQFELVINDRNKNIVGKLSDDELKDLPEDADTFVYSIKGQLAYINAQAHLSRFENSTSKYKNIVLRMRELYFIDLDGVEAFDELVTIIQKSGKRVVITGANPLIEKSLNQGQAYGKLRHMGLVFDKTSDALRFLGFPGYSKLSTPSIDTI
jgi:sulfate permease, SulP family